MDDIDRATESQDFFAELAVKRVYQGQNLSKEGGDRIQIDLYNPTRKCFVCLGETESTRHRWCSPECRRDWEIDNE